MNSGNSIALIQIAGHFLMHIPAQSVTPLMTKVWAEVRWSVSRAEQDTLKPERQVSSSYWFSGWRGQVWKLEENMKHDWGKDRMSWNQMPKMQGYQCVQGHIPGEAESNTTQARPGTWNRDRLFVCDPFLFVWRQLLLCCGITLFQRISWLDQIMWVASFLLDSHCLRLSLLAPCGVLHGTQ